MGDYKDLLVWQKAMDFAEEVYRMTQGFPKDEVYGLTSQMRRSAVSMPSNIAEGSSRGGKKEFVHFLTIARGSAAEAETQMLLAKRIGYVTDVGKLLDMVSSIRQMINALIRSLREKM